MECLTVAKLPAGPKWVYESTASCVFSPESESRSADSTSTFSMRCAICLPTPSSMARLLPDPGGRPNFNLHQAVIVSVVHRRAGHRLTRSEAFFRVAEISSGRSILNPLAPKAGGGFQPPIYCTLT
jgi:hypothetical protein